MASARDISVAKRNAGAALRALGVLGFHDVDGFALRVELFAQGGELSLQSSGFSLHFREARGQHDAELRPHFITQLREALSLCRLAFQRIHLPLNLVEDVIDAGQVQLRIGQT